MHRTTIMLSDETYESLRREAFEKRTSVSELIRGRLEGGKAKRKARKASENPLLRVAGIFSDGTMNINLDEELYDL